MILTKKYLLIWPIMALFVLDQNTCGAHNTNEPIVIKKEPAPSVSVSQPCDDVKPNAKFDDKNTIDENSESTSNNNCTDDIMAVEPVLYDYWKLHVIMACTVTAAVEFVIIILIIFYWKQIRWTLRKIPCPCDNCHQHEAMERDNVDTDLGQSVDVQPDNELEVQSDTIQQDEVPSDVQSFVDPDGIHTDVQSDAHIIQIYSAPWCSRVQFGDDNTDGAVPGPSGLCRVIIHHSGDVNTDVSSDISSDNSDITDRTANTGHPVVSTTPHEVTAPSKPVIKSKQTSI